MSNSKLIISCKKPLELKYGAANFKKVNALLARLVTADKKKILDTRIIYTDDQTSTATAGISLYASTGEKDCKNAVDDIYTKLKPDYILLFGAQDIFPLRTITNPANDEDHTVPSNLPYACDAPYGTEAKDFTGPNRVVGRLPDVPAKGDLDYVKTLIEAAIVSKPGKEKDYQKCPKAVRT